MSTEGYKYYINFFDAFSNYNWVFPLVHKSEVMEIFEKFKRCTELQTSYKVKKLQTNDALEFKKLRGALTKLGIEHQFSCPYSHQQMDSLERKYRHLIDTEITLLKHASIPIEFGIMP